MVLRWNAIKAQYNIFIYLVRSTLYLILIESRLSKSRWNIILLNIYIYESFSPAVRPWRVFFKSYSKQIKEGKKDKHLYKSSWGTYDNPFLILI